MLMVLKLLVSFLLILVLVGIMELLMIVSGPSVLIRMLIGELE